MKQKVLKNIFNILTIIVLIFIVFMIYFIYTYDDIKSSTNPNRAYVINLDKRPERWENIQKSFKNSSIELIRLPAIENKQGHIGCGLSFMKAVKYAKKHNMKTILIFEDDNKPLEGFDQRWQIIKNWLDNNLEKWEIFNGGARFPDWQEYEKKTISSYADTTHLKYSIDNKEYLFEAPFIVSTNWIYINISCYDKVLKWESMINDTPFIPIDQYMTKTEYFKCIFSIPHLALQENGKSDTSMNSQNGYWEFNKVDERLIEIFKNSYNREVN